MLQDEHILLPILCKVIYKTYCRPLEAARGGDTSECSGLSQSHATY